MQSSLRIVPILVVGLGLLLYATVTTRSQSEELLDVFVTNFPELQRVSGSVSVDGTIKHSNFEKIEEIVIPPIGPADPRKLIDGGTIATDGFTSLVLSLSGQPGGKAFQAGAVGVILTPEEEAITKVFKEEGKAQFSIEVEAAVEAGPTKSFTSEPTRMLIAFPAYRVWFYNTTQKSVKANLFVYLTN